MKEKAIGKIIAGLLICLMIVSVFGGIIDATSATNEKTTVSVTESSPWFTKGSNSGHPELWYSHTYQGHNYISTYVGGMSSNPSQPDCWAKFKPYLSQSGKCEVYAYFYACKDTSTKVPFTVKYDGGSTTIKVNQYRSSPAWKERYLGTWNFKAGADTYVKVTDATGETYNSITGLSVGAIKFVKVQTTTVPSPPRNLRVTEVGSSYVKIAWDTPSSDGGSPITNYKIYRGTSSGTETLYYTTSTAGTTFNNCANIVNGVTYYYKVKAVNAVDDSDFSKEVSATPTSGTSVACFDGQRCYSTEEEAVSHVPTHVVPRDCFVWNDGPTGYPWRPIPGTGCAHWVAHQLGIRRGATCYEGHSIRVSDVIYGRTEVEINSCKVGDIWTNSDSTHCGIVRQLGNGKVWVEHDSSGQDGVVKNWFSTGKCWTLQPNQPPTLSSGSLTPPSGDTTTTFNYYVTYKDPDGDAPTTKYVYIDGSPHPMTKISGDYISGATFKYSMTLSAGSHNYYFYFNDGHGHTVRLPTSGASPGPTILTTTPTPSPTPTLSPSPTPTATPSPTPIPTLQPDLIVYDIWIEPAEFEPGDTVKLRQRTKNIGDGDAVGTFRIKRYFDGTYMGYYNRNGLTAGQSFTTYKTYTWPSDCNSHTIKVVVDTEDAITESNEGNNERSESFSAIYPSPTPSPYPTPSPTPTTTPTLTLTPTPSPTPSPTPTPSPSPTPTATPSPTPIPTIQPDLIVYDIWIEPAEFGLGDTVKLRQRTKNIGDGDAVGTFKIKRYFDGTYMGYYNRNGLTAGQSFTTYKTYTWPSDCNSHTIKVVVDTEDAITESNEGNNEHSESFSAICPGPTPSPSPTPSPTPTSTPTSTPTPSLGVKAANFAKQVIGAPYLWGGKGWQWNSATGSWKGGKFVDSASIKNGYYYRNPSTGKVEFGKGLDCSGLVFWAFNKAAGTHDYPPGKSTDYVCPIYYEGAHGQWNDVKRFENISTKIPQAADLKPGYLLFLDTPDRGIGKIDHVGMYVGNGYVIHSQGDKVVEKKKLKNWLDILVEDGSKKYKDYFVGYGRIKTSLLSEDPFNYHGQYVFDISKLRSEEKSALPYVMKYAKEYKISPALIMAIIRQESNFNPNAKSSTGAVGYMQMTYIAAKDAGYTLSREQWSKDGLDPDTNIKYGSKYLRILYDRYKNSNVYDSPLKNVVSAYYSGHPTKDSEWYVNQVIKGRDVIDGQQRGYNFFLTITQSSSLTPIPIPTAALSVSPNPAYVGDPITIKVDGKDDTDVKYLSAYYSGNWHRHECTGIQAHCGYSWTTSESTPGKYKYYGYIKDNENNGAWSTPKSIEVTVNPSSSPPSATLSVSPKEVSVGDPITIKVDGKDATDVKYLSAYYSGNWHRHECTGIQTHCGYSWTTSESTPGKYKYYGYIKDNENNGAWSTPKSIEVTVKS